MVFLKKQHKHTTGTKKKLCVCIKLNRNVNKKFPKSEKQKIHNPDDANKLMHKPWFTSENKWMKMRNEQMNRKK